MAVTQELAQREAARHDELDRVEVEMAKAVAARYPVPAQGRDVVGATVDERKKQHGEFREHAEYTQRIKQVLHSAPNWLKLTFTQKEGLEMLAHKVGRILAGDPNHPDHWLDIEGYTRITRERL